MARARRRPRRSSSRSTTRAARARRATASAPTLEYDRGADRPLPRALARATARSTLDQTALRQAAAHARGVRAAGGHPGSTCHGRTLTSRAARQTAAATTTGGTGLHGHSPVPQAPRSETLQAVHPRLSAAVSVGADVSDVSRREAAPGSAAGARGGTHDRRGAELPVDRLSDMARRRWRCRRSSSRSRSTSSPRPVIACGSCATSGSTYLSLNRACAHAVRRRSAAHRPRQLPRLAVWSTRCTCSTSHRSGCTPRDMDRLLRLCCASARRREHGAGGRARSRGDSAGRFHGRAGAGQRDQWRRRRLQPDRSSRAAESPLTGQYLTGRAADPAAC